MMLRMKERFTISVESEVLQIARAEVESGRAPSVSAAVEEALKARGRSQGLQEAVRLSEAEHGPISEEAKEWARKELERAFQEIASSTPER
jgi:Arc/MetJ-type ribon-helix-helix transcriptional regulator